MLSTTSASSSSSSSSSSSASADKAIDLAKVLNATYAELSQTENTVTLVAFINAVQLKYPFNTSFYEYDSASTKSEIPEKGELTASIVFKYILLTSDIKIDTDAAELAGQIKELTTTEEHELYLFLMAELLEAEREAFLDGLSFNLKIQFSNAIPKPTNEDVYQRCKEISLCLKNNQIDAAMDALRKLADWLSNDVPLKLNVSNQDDDEGKSGWWLLCSALSWAASENNTKAVESLTTFLTTQLEKLSEKDCFAGLAQICAAGDDKGISGWWLLCAAIHWAASENNTKAVESLTTFLTTQLEKLSEKDCFAALAQIREAGNGKGKSGWWLLCSAIHWAASKNNTKAVESLTTFLTTQLEKLSEKDCFAGLAQICAAGDDKGISGWWILCSAIRWAVSKNNTKAVESLTTFLTTQLEKLSEKDCFAGLAQICAAGDDKGISGWWLLCSALSWAASENNTKAVESLTTFLTTQLHKLSAEERSAALAKICEAGDDKGISGWWLLCSAIHWAASKNNTKAVESLTTFLTTQLEKLSEKDCFAALAQICEAGNGKGKSGWWLLCSAIHWAASKNNTKAVESLTTFLTTQLEKLSEKDCFAGLAQICAAGDDKGISGWWFLHKTLTKHSFRSSKLADVIIVLVANGILFEEYKADSGNLKTALQSAHKAQLFGKFAQRIFDKKNQHPAAIIQALNTNAFQLVFDDAPLLELIKDVRTMQRLLSLLACTDEEDSDKDEIKADPHTIKTLKTALKYLVFHKIHASLEEDNLPTQDKIVAGFKLLKNCLDNKKPLGKFLRKQQSSISAFWSVATTDTIQWLIKHALKPFFDAHRQSFPEENSQAMEAVKELLHQITFSDTDANRLCQALGTLVFELETSTPSAGVSAAGVVELETSTPSAALTPAGVVGGGKDEEDDDATEMSTVVRPKSSS